MKAASAAEHAWENCPDFFEPNPDDNLSQVVEKYRRGELGKGETPDILIDCVVDAADNLPRRGHSCLLMILPHFLKNKFYLLSD